MKLSITRKLHEKDSDNIEQAFKIAKRVKRGENFLKDEIEENPERKRKVNKRIKEFNTKLLN